MYSYIRGILVRRSEDAIVVDNNGIGYQIVCPFGISSELGDTNSETTVYIYQSVKEDGISLFGFSSQAQKDMFLLLITVSSVGPKVAMSICSQLDPDSLAVAVVNNDISLLTSIKGLGKKTAERIILELRDKLSKNIKSKPSGRIQSSASSVGADTNILSDAISALVVLGYKENDAKEAVMASMEDNIELQNVIKKALRLLAR